MFALLNDMFQRGHPADVAFFVVGAWLLALFLGVMLMQIVRRLRRKPSNKSPQASQAN